MLERLWIYQKERFPILALGLLAFAVALSSLGFSSLLRGAGGPSAHALLLATAAALLFWMQMRVLDEIKDADDDRRFRAYRPVPRGLVTLDELRRLLVAAAIGEVAIALTVDVRLLWGLAALWAYLALMSVEFFARDWLRARPGIYMASHCPIGLLVCLYLCAFDWLPANARPDPALLWIAAANLFATLLLEIGRKIRAPEDEERGVVT
jgi:4-hydroxybenzoate polyprenyltransferase